MKRVFCYLLFIFVLSSCSQAGTEGGKCLEGNACLGNDLTCNYQGKCVHCGAESELCCDGSQCGEGLACNEYGYCHVCGGYGAPCCEGNRCNENTVCGVNNTCEFCGSEGEPCCEDSTCSIFSVCGAAGICIACGHKGEPCCEGEEYTGCLDAACTSDGTCNDEICFEDDICLECGNSDQPCCEGGTCNSGYICAGDNTCENCGYRGYPACVGGACDGWWQNINGYCENPFESDPAASVSMCEQVRAGHSRSERDWCYWYAAFYKNDQSICELIEWEEMKGKCLEMEDPDDYHVMYW